MAERIAWLKDNGHLLEAQRLEQRTLYDLEMLREVGYALESKTTRAIWTNGRQARHPGH